MTVVNLPLWLIRTDYLFDLTLIHRWSTALALMTFEPSRRLRGDPGGRQTTSELNQAEAETISLDGVQVALHLASFAHYGSNQLEGRQGGKGQGFTESALPEPQHYPAGPRR